MRFEPARLGAQYALRERYRPALWRDLPEGTANLLPRARLARWFAQHRRRRLLRKHLRPGATVVWPDDALLTWRQAHEPVRGPHPDLETWWDQADTHLNATALFAVWGNGAVWQPGPLPPTRGAATVAETSELSEVPVLAPHEFARLPRDGASGFDLAVFLNAHRIRAEEGLAALLRAKQWAAFHDPAGPGPDRERERTIALDAAGEDGCTPPPCPGRIGLPASPMPGRNWPSMCRARRKRQRSQGAERSGSRLGPLLGAVAARLPPTQRWIAHPSAPDDMCLLLPESPSGASWALLPDGPMPPDTPDPKAWLGARVALARRRGWHVLPIIAASWAADPTGEARRLLRAAAAVTSP